MRPPIELFLSPNSGIELIYSFTIILCSLMIYYATREMYKLSSYKGIKYFRQAFLFFAIAYFFRYSIKFLLIFFNTKRIIELSPAFIGFVSLFVFLYSSSMAIFYLVYSIMWKKWKSSKLAIILFNILAITISFVGTFLMGFRISILLGLVLLTAASILPLKDYKKGNKKKNNLFAIYVLLFLFLILNIADILIPEFLEFYQIMIYISSIAIFMTILYKVLKKIGD